MTWNDLGWLREHTKLPLLLKGLQHPTMRPARSIAKWTA